MKKGSTIALWIGIPLGIICLTVIALSIIGTIGMRYSFVDTDEGYYSNGLTGGGFREANPAPMADFAEEGFLAAGSSYSDKEGEVDMRAAETPHDRLIIKTGQLAMVVKDVRGAVQAITNYVAEKGGFVVNSEVSKEDVEVSGSITVRIPVTTFDQAQEDVKAMGEVTSQQVSGQDVNEE